MKNQKSREEEEEEEEEAEKGSKCATQLTVPLRWRVWAAGAGGREEGDNMKCI